MPAALLPARHLEQSGSNPIQSEKLRATQRGCRRDIRSNGWIELSGSARASKAGPAEENRFSSFGADCLRSAIPPATSWSMGSGPDVFADALAPARGKLRPAFRLPFQYCLPGSFAFARIRVRSRHFPLPPWLSVCEIRRVNRPLTVRQSSQISSLFRLGRLPRPPRVYTRFIATLKLPFKFDRP